MERLTKKLINKFKEEVGITKAANGKTKSKEERKKGDAKGDKDSQEGNPEDEEEEEEEEEVPFEKKVQFTEKVRRLTNEGLTRLVKKIKETCPAALEDIDSEKLHIKVDQIDKESFQKLD
jgi:hypothetical protein